VSEPKPTVEPESRSFSALKELIQAGRPLIYVRSAEETRVHQLLEDVCQHLFATTVPIWTWSLTEGLRGPDGAAATDKRLGAREVLDFVLQHQKPGVFQLQDFHEFLGDAHIRRMLRDVYERSIDTNKFAVITSPLRVIPEELDRQLVFMELHNPDLAELLAFLRHETARLTEQGVKVDGSEEALFQMARALQGLTVSEARHALRRAVAVAGNLDHDSLPHLLEEKKLLVNKTGLIEYVADGTEIGHVGGLHYLKEWLLERRKLFLERDSLAAEIVPKGLLVMGVSGCGKSLSVKSIASCFELPLYRIDMIEVFSGRHGTPDGAFVQACRGVEAVAPAVVWFDEIEMGITAQMTGDAAADLGRIFAFFLTWMQEKARGLFVAATANRIDLLPAEMIRKGRFDEVFFVDLPTDQERVEIFRIHLEKRGIDPAHFQLDRLKKFTRGWTGAEVEQCVVAAMTTARLADRSLEDNDLLNIASTMVPLSKTMREQVDHIRSWAYDRAVRASPREGER
jgi:ATP-dependent 26S proteasome regulatory subunit